MITPGVEGEEILGSKKEMEFGIIKLELEVGLKMVGI